MSKERIEFGSSKNAKKQMPKPAAKPKAKAARKNQRPKMPKLISFEPLSPNLVPTVQYQANALAHTGMVRSERTVSSALRTLVVVTNTGMGGTMGYIREKAAGSSGVMTVPLLASSSSAGGPTSGRAMKAGLTIVNNTADISCGGRVYFLNSDSRVALPAAPSLWSDAEFDTVINHIISHPQCRSLSGKQLQRPTHFTSHVVDPVDYEGFTDWAGTETVDQFGAHWGTWSGASARIRPMSTLFIVFDEPAADQTYTLTMRASYYNRWPLDTVGGQVMHPIPLTTAEVLAVSQKVAATVTKEPSH